MTDRHPMPTVKQLAEAGQWSECGSAIIYISERVESAEGCFGVAETGKP